MAQNTSTAIIAMGIQGNLIRPGPGVNTRNQAGLLVVVLSAVATADLLDYSFPILAGYSNLILGFT